MIRLDDVQSETCPPAAKTPFPHFFLTIEPANRRGLFVARVAADFWVLCRSRQPFVDAARVLLREGIDPGTILISRRAGQDHDSLRSRVGLAAKVTVDEHNGTVFAKYKPLSCSAVPRRMRFTEGGGYRGSSRDSGGLQLTVASWAGLSREGR